MSSSLKDQCSAAIFLVLGVAMFIGGYTMDRLEIRQIHPASIPGLVPMILGALLSICAIILFIQAKNKPTNEDHSDDERLNDSSIVIMADEQNYPPSLRFFMTLGLSLIYALLLIGNLPFMLATGIYIFCFALFFAGDDFEPPSHTPSIKTILICAVVAIVASYSITILFEDGFLVRLP